LGGYGVVGVLIDILRQGKENTPNKGANTGAHPLKEVREVYTSQVQCFSPLGAPKRKEGQEKDGGENQEPHLVFVTKAMDGVGEVTEGARELLPAAELIEVAVLRGLFLGHSESTK
jgi:hypothetical protein